MSKILLVEDDLSIITGLSYALKKEGYEVFEARTMTEAERMMQIINCDLILLDVSLPDGSGFDFCRTVRRTSKVPIVFLTACDEEIDMIMGLDMGGDDYITKPFKLAVLLSRINAILRRSRNFPDNNNTLTSNGITIDLSKGTAYKNEENLELTAGEFRLLSLFIQNPGIILSHETILNRLWDTQESFVDNNTLTVYIRRLRTKIEDNPSEPNRIITVRRMGYKWSD